jgi:hypothetical protein
MQQEWATMGNANCNISMDKLFEFDVGGRLRGHDDAILSVMEHS